VCLVYQQIKGKPLSAATIRTGPDYIEVPFVATHESKRGRGFGRCVVEAIEDVARALNIPRMLLCSTCETSVSQTWKHLGFHETNEQQLAGWNVEDSDLVHMQNTLQVCCLGGSESACRGGCCWADCWQIVASFGKGMAAATSVCCHPGIPVVAACLNCLVLQLPCCEWIMSHLPQHGQFNVTMNLTSCCRSNLSCLVQKCIHKTLRSTATPGHCNTSICQCTH